MLPTFPMKWASCQCEKSTVLLSESIPDNNFYAAIDQDIRCLVKLLRDNGINTTNSCAHEGYIQFDVQDDGDVLRIHYLLCTNGYRGYGITTHFGFPCDGMPYYWGELRLDEREHIRLISGD